jgi:hypothetical protein
MDKSEQRLAAFLGLADSDASLRPSWTALRSSWRTADRGGYRPANAFADIENRLFRKPWWPRAQQTPRTEPFLGRLN